MDLSDPPGLPEALRTTRPVPIAQLPPGHVLDHQRRLDAIVTLVWPYSSATESMTVLLAEPDMRLRNQKGQVRVVFRGAAAKQIAQCKIGYGDVVMLGLVGAHWKDDSAGAPQDGVSTPGRSVEGELVFTTRLVLQAQRQGKVQAAIDLDVLEEARPSPPLESPDPVEVLAPATPTPRAKSPPAISQTEWASPFRARSGLVVKPSDDDPFLGGEPHLKGEIDIDARGVKRSKFGRGSGQWRYVDRSPSPTKESEAVPAKQPGSSTAQPTNPKTPQVPMIEVEDLHASHVDTLPITNNTLPQLVTHFDTTPQTPSNNLLTATIPATPSSPKLEPVASPGLPLVSPLMVSKQPSGAWSQSQSQEHWPPQIPQQSLLNPLQDSMRPVSIASSTDRDLQDFGSSVQADNVPIDKSLMIPPEEAVFDPSEPSKFDAAPPNEGFAINQDRQSTPRLEDGPLEPSLNSFDTKTKDAMTIDDNRTKHATIHAPYPTLPTDAEMPDHQIAMPVPVPQGEVQHSRFDELHPTTFKFETALKLPEPVVLDPEITSELIQDTVVDSQAMSAENFDSQGANLSVSRGTDSSAPTQGTRSKGDGGSENLSVAQEPHKHDSNATFSIHQPTVSLHVPDGSVVGGQYSQLLQDSMMTNNSLDTLEQLVNDADENDLLFAQRPVLAEDLTQTTDDAEDQQHSLSGALSDVGDQRQRPSKSKIASHAEIGLPDIVAQEHQAPRSQIFDTDVEISVTREEPSRAAFRQADVDGSAPFEEEKSKHSLPEQDDFDSAKQSLIVASSPSGIGHSSRHRVDQLLDGPLHAQEIAEEGIQQENKTSKSAPEGSSSRPEAPGAPLAAESMPRDRAQGQSEDEAQVQTAGGEAKTAEEQEETSPKRRSSRVRTPKVPDALSTWFAQPSRKRSKSSAKAHIALDDAPAVAAAPQEEGNQSAGSKVSSIKETKKHVGFVEPGQVVQTAQDKTRGFRTPLSYYAPLSAAEVYLNATSSQGDACEVDYFAVVTSKTSPPARAKSGPKDHYTVMHVSDASIFPKTIQTECFRPYKKSLPEADVGDVILLRSFAVKSRERDCYLISAGASAWHVWQFPVAAATAALDVSGDSSKMATPLKEESKGPPVELGDEEREHAIALRTWWLAAKNSQVEAASPRTPRKDRRKQGSKDKL